MHDLDTALVRISEIYDAALDPGLWPPTLEKIARFVGGPAAALVSQDVVAGKGRFAYSWGDDPHYSRLYFERYVSLNPARAPMMLLKPGEVRSLSAMIPHETFRENSFL